MIGKYNKSVILTYVGACLSVLGIMLSLKGKLSYAVICLIFSGICDLFDGVIARKCERDAVEKEFGVQIDSLTDIMSFIAFPCVIGFYLMRSAGVWAYPVLAIYTLCGIIRLAWFNIKTNSEGGLKYYDGLPVTYSALIIPVFYLFKGIISDLHFSLLAMAVYIITALFFVMEIKISKPKGIWYGIFGLLSIIVAVLIIVEDA